MSHDPHVDVVIVGAGSAGIGAAKAARERGMSFTVLEASHRIGGRALTEMLAPGVPFDLGCHWLHSASLNPYVEIANRLGFGYRKGTFSRHTYLGNAWVTETEASERDAFMDAAHESVMTAARDSRDISIMDATERDSRWTSVYDYWISLITSRDSDQVSVMDLHNYRDTGEDWPLEDGYGALVARFGADVPVSLNHAVEEIDWRHRHLKVCTARGDVTARKAIVSVSTGVLAAGDIRFSPSLPQWKQEAIAALPLGNHNRICLLLDGDAPVPDYPPSVSYVGSESEQMWFSLRPFGHDYAVGVTGGRFAWWLERAGIAASVDLATEHLVKIFGSDIRTHVVGHRVSAWGGDAWTRGAYSAARPGHGHRRHDLARPIDERLYFAGEATSPDFFATAHGAFLSGVRAANRVADSLGRPPAGGTQTPA